MKIYDRLYKLIALYISPNQSQDQYEYFKEILELNLELAVENNPFSVVHLSNFNPNQVKVKQ